MRIGQQMRKMWEKAEIKTISFFYTKADCPEG